jgi:signal peptidase I
MSNALALSRILFLPLVIAVGAALLVRATFLQTFSIPSASMYPTLVPGDHIIVTPYRGVFRKPPSRGDVVVFRAVRRESFSLSASSASRETPLRSAVDGSS